MRTNNNVRGIIIEKDKILLIHRFKNGNEYWVVPGGGVEEGETLEEALKREMKEETGRELREFILVKMYENGEDKQYYYRCSLEEGEIEIGGPEKEDQNENNQYILTWVPIGELKEMKNVYPESLMEMVFGS